MLLAQYLLLALLAAGAGVALDRPTVPLLIVTVMLVAMAVVNAVFITRATLQDSRHASAVTRALGATPGQVTAGLCAAQVLPARWSRSSRPRPRDLLSLPGGFVPVRRRA